MKKILMGSILISSLLSANNSVQVNINDDTLEVGADLYLNKYYDMNNDSNYYLTVRHLRTEEKNDSTQSLTSLGFKLVNPMTDNNGISLGLGMKSVYSNQISQSFFALPLGLNGRIELNELIYIDAEVSYAPRVLSFADAKSFSDFQARINYKILNNGYVYIGGRNVQTKYEDGTKKKFDNTAFLGFEVKF